MPSHLEPGASPSEVSEFNKLQEFVRDACPSSWLECAEELRDAAELIWERQEDGLRVGITLTADFEALNEPRRISKVSRTYMLLAGFALENVVKGLLVFADPSHVNVGVLSDELKSHNIATLASKIRDLKLSDGEETFCRNATDALPYWGRYPIPLRKGQVSPEIGIDETLRQAFLSLFDRLAYQLYWAVRDGWDSGVGPKTIKIRSSKYGDRIDPSEPFF
jgi:hypothetical protein